MFWCWLWSSVCARANGVQLINTDTSTNRAVILKQRFICAVTGMGALRRHEIHAFRMETIAYAKTMARGCLNAQDWRRLSSTRRLKQSADVRCQLNMRWPGRVTNQVLDQRSLRHNVAQNRH